MLCKKGHLLYPEDHAKLEKIIDNELATIMSEGDVKKDAMLCGSDDEGLHDEQQNEPCAGYKNLQDDSKCAKQARFILTVQFETGSRFFCKGSHLVRYLVRHCCGQGKPAKTTGTKNKRKRE